MSKIKYYVQKICWIIYRLGASASIKQNKHAMIMGSSFISKDTQIGDYSYIGYDCFITKTEIGRYVSIANGVQIGQGEHDLSRISNSSSFYDEPYNVLTEQKCIIESDVWIGAGSIIRRGVTIGTGAIIGANSFVNKDIPPFAIAVGSPAKIVRYKFSPSQMSMILYSKWWEKDLKEAYDVLKRMERRL